MSAMDLIRAIDVYLNCVPGASMVATREGMRALGADANHKLLSTDPRADSAAVILTANTETTYASSFLDLGADGPLVLEAPPNALGFVDDFWQRFVADIGLAGPTRARAASTSCCHPATTETFPMATSRCGHPRSNVWLVLRALGGVPDMLTTRIYPLAALTTRRRPSSSTPPAEPKSRADPEVPRYLSDRLGGLGHDPHRSLTELGVVLPTYLWHRYFS